MDIAEETLGELTEAFDEHKWPIIAFFGIIIMARFATIVNNFFSYLWDLIPI